MSRTTASRRGLPWRGLLLAGGLLALLAGIVAWSLATTGRTTTGAGLAPPLTLATAEGTFDVAAQHGKVLVLYLSFVG